MMSHCVERFKKKIQKLSTRPKYAYLFKKSLEVWQIQPKFGQIDQVGFFLDP